MEESFADELTTSAMAVPCGKQPFAMLVDPDSIQAAAARIAAMGLPRVVVKAFTDKETPGRKPRNRQPAASMAV